MADKIQLLVHESVGDEREAALMEVLKGDPIISELVDKCLAMGVVPVIKFAEVVNIDKKHKNK